MTRDDFDYLPISNAMVAGLLYIVEKDGAALGVNDRLTLARKILREYLDRYEKENHIKLPTEIILIERPGKKPVKAYKPR